MYIIILFTYYYLYIIIYIVFMFIMYNIISTFIIPIKGISNQTSDLFFSFKISYLFIKIQGVYAT